MIRLYEYVYTAQAIASSQALSAPSCWNSSRENPDHNMGLTMAISAEENHIDM